MFIVGTKKIGKGILMIPSLNYKVKAGGKYPVSDMDLRNPDVRRPLQAGSIKLEGAPDGFNPLSLVESDDLVLCKNVLCNSLVIDGHDGAIRRGAEFKVHRSALSEPGLKKLISNRLVEILDEGDDLDLEEEAVVDLGPDEPALGAEASPELETNEEMDMPTDVLEELPQEVKSVPDPRKSAVIWNPSGNEPVVKNNLKATVWSKGKAVQAEQGPPPQQTEILFVDQEQRAEAIKKHPVLSKKAEKKTDEPNFVLEENNTEGEG